MRESWLTSSLTHPGMLRKADPSGYVAVFFPLKVFLLMESFRLAFLSWSANAKQTSFSHARMFPQSLHPPLLSSKKKSLKGTFFHYPHYHGDMPEESRSTQAHWDNSIAYNSLLLSSISSQNTCTRHTHIAGGHVCCHHKAQSEAGSIAHTCHQNRVPFHSAPPTLRH